MTRGMCPADFKDWLKPDPENTDGCRGVEKRGSVAVRANHTINRFQRVR